MTKSAKKRTSHDKNLNDLSKKIESLNMFCIFSGNAFSSNRRHKLKWAQKGTGRIFEEARPIWPTNEFEIRCNFLKAKKKKIKNKIKNY